MESVEPRVGAEAAGMARAMVELAAAEREGAMEGRWARLPRRCISRETSWGWVWVLERRSRA